MWPSYLASRFFSDAAHDPLDALHPDFQLHPEVGRVQFRRLALFSREKGAGEVAEGVKSPLFSVKFQLLIVNFRPKSLANLWQRQQHFFQPRRISF